MKSKSATIERFVDYGGLGAWLLDGSEEREAIAVLRSRSLFRHYGPELLHKASQLEQRVCDTVSSTHALAVNSGTSALRCAIAALEPRPGDEVIVPPCTFAATANAVVLAGAIPVFAEIDESLGLDPQRLAERMTPRTVGIIAVHLQGMACRIEELADVARRHGLWLVEDCAQSFGVTIGGRHTGTFGDLGAYSLQLHKTITCGEGGVLVTSHGGLFQKARRFQDQGGDREGDEYPSWDTSLAGFGENLKIGEVPAAIALAQLAKLEEIRTRMGNVFDKLQEQLDLHGRSPRVEPDPSGHIPYSMIFFARDAANRNRILAAMQAQSIPCDGLYPEPLYRHAPFVRWSRGENVFGCPGFGFQPVFEPCPTSEDLMRRIVRIPLSPLYEDDEIQMLAQSWNAVLRNQ